MNKYMSRFKRTAATPYTIITPSTPLAELEAFLAEVELAIHLQPALANATTSKRAEYLLYFCSQDGVVGSWIKASHASVAGFGSNYQLLL